MKEFWNHLLHEFQLPLDNPVLVFSLILFIILLSPILLRKLNIPGIIGLIISGVAIGPHGLNVLEQNSAIELFSTIGLLYIMFIAGLELDMNEFKANRNKSLLFGLFTFAIPLGIGFPVCFYLLDYDVNASFLTASMFATHTLVAYPIVSRLGISKNQAVAVTVGGTILTDTAVLIILAVVMGNSQGTLDAEFWIRLGVSLTIFTAIMFFIVPRIAQWFFSKLESEKQSHYIFVLAVVFFAAFLAELAGVEPIIGAFVAGLALNRLIPHSSALMNRIEFIGNALFIPFFLISVGMLVDLRVIFSGSGAWIVAGALTVVALFGKWAAAFITQLVFRYTKAQRQLIFGLSSAHAAATLAVILVGYKAGILDDNILNGTIILILITCIVASFATENAAKSILIAMDDGELEPEGNSALQHEVILLPIANLMNMDKLLEFSGLIKDQGPGNISILSVVSNDDEAEANILKAHGQLEKFVKQATASESEVNVLATIDHNPASGIARVAKETFANLIVLGWPRQIGLLDKLIGQKVDSLLSNTDRSVLVVHMDRPMVSIKRLFVVAPPLAERESGFELWFGKLAKLTRELSIPMEIHCHQVTGEAFEKMRKRKKLAVNMTIREFDDWDDFLVLSRMIEEDDLLVLVSARKSSASYLSALDNLPDKLERYFSSNSRIIIYPQQKSFSGNMNYSGISPGPMQQLSRLGRELGRFGRDSSDPSKS
jgi:Kef-type K+ transport system membrane component KefB